MRISIINFLRNAAIRFIQASRHPFRDVKDSDLEYLLWITSVYLRIRNIPGHIVEIGVASGRNTVLFGRLIHMFNEGSVRQYLGFDTFAGYSERDLDANKHLSAKAWKEFSKSGVEERCKNVGVADVIELFEGDAVATVPDVLANHRGKKFQPGGAKIALLYIDCNAFEPAIASMRNCYRHMMPGGLIVIDEKLQGGESRALTEFASEMGLVVERLGPNEVPMAIVIPKKP